jgi:hypothetical protein
VRVRAKNGAGFFEIVVASSITYVVLVCRGPMERRPTNEIDQRSAIWGTEPTERRTILFVALCRVFVKCAKDIDKDMTLRCRA